MPILLDPLTGNCGFYPPADPRPSACRRGSIAANILMPDRPNLSHLRATLAAAKAALWRHGGIPAQRLALVQTYVECAEEGAFPPFATIAERAGLSLRTAWRRKAEIVAAGWVETVRRAVDGSQTSNACRVKLPDEPGLWSDLMMLQRAAEGLPGYDWRAAVRERTARWQAEDEAELAVLAEAAELTAEDGAEDSLGVTGEEVCQSGTPSSTHPVPLDLKNSYQGEEGPGGSKEKGYNPLREMAALGGPEATVRWRFANQRVSILSRDYPGAIGNGTIRAIPRLLRTAVPKAHLREDFRRPVLVIQVPATMEGMRGWSYAAVIERVRQRVKARWRRVPVWVTVDPGLDDTDLRITVRGPADHPSHTYVQEAAGVIFTERLVERWVSTAA